MPSKIRHGLIISITVVALLFSPAMISYSETTTYVYDEFNRLIQVSSGDGPWVTYTCDASGNRVTLTQTADTVPPTGAITINSGTAVTLALTCSENVVSSCSSLQKSSVLTPPATKFWG